MQINKSLKTQWRMFMLFLACRISHAHCTLYTYTHRHSIFLAPRHGQRVRCSCIRVRFRTCHEMSGNAKQRIISLDHICFGKFSIIILLKIFHSFLNGIDLNLSQMNMKSTYHFDLFKSQKNTYLYITFVYSSLRYHIEYTEKTTQ